MRQAGRNTMTASLLRGAGQYATGWRGARWRTLPPPWNPIKDFTCPGRPGWGLTHGTHPGRRGLGNVVAQPQRAAGTVPGASGEQIGQALGQAAGGMLDQMDGRRAPPLPMKAAARMPMPAQGGRKGAGQRAHTGFLGRSGLVARRHRGRRENRKDRQDQAGAEWQRLANERVTQAVEVSRRTTANWRSPACNTRTQVLGRGITKAVTQRDQADAGSGQPDAGIHATPVPEKTARRRPAHQRHAGAAGAVHRADIGAGARGWPVEGIDPLQPGNHAGDGRAPRQQSASMRYPPGWLAMSSPTSDLQRRATLSAQIEGY